MALGAGARAATHVTLSDLECFPPIGRRRRQGRDEAQALLELWTTLTDQHNSADAVGCVADAYFRRTGRQPDSVHGQDHGLALVATVTRFKELRRIERAIEHRDEAELR